jgi:5-methylcytosine-specific restriction endonuclease McrA
MIDVQQLYKDQVAYYKGDKYKAWLSILPELRVQVPEPASSKDHIIRSKWEAYNYTARALTHEYRKALDLYHKDMDVDHIVPVSYGFRRGIPVELIASPQNLQLMLPKDNRAKGKNLTVGAVYLCELWGYPCMDAWKQKFKRIKCLT